MPLRTEYINARVKEGKRYYQSIKYPLIPPSIDDIYITTSNGDRLDLLANLFYKNVDYWWIIANANPGVVRRDGFVLKPGIEIRIPQNIQKVLEDFIESNK